MKIRGIEGLSADQVDFELKRGAKFVIFYYCISLVVVTFKRTSDIYFVKPGESTPSAGLICSIVCLLLGIWGIPFGIIWSISSIITNLRGGKNVTQEVVASLNRNSTQSPQTPAQQGW